MRVGLRSVADLDSGILRLNGSYYLSADRVLSDALEGWSGDSRLAGDVAEIFKGNIFRRIYVDDVTHSRPYVSASDLDRTDYWGCRRISTIHGTLLDELALTEGMTVITRSGVNLGWGAMVRPDLSGVVGSDDLIRVVASDAADGPYIGAFLCSAPGVLSIRKYTYASSIKHVEPEHVAAIRIPWPARKVRDSIGKEFWLAATKRSESSRLIEQATESLFRHVGLSDVDDSEWQKWGRDTGFAGAASQLSLRAWNYSPRAQRLLNGLRSVPNQPLVDLVVPRSLRKGPSFARIDASPPFSVQLIGQRQLFRYVPDGREIDRGRLPKGAFCAPGTIAIASVGTFGEAEVFCRAQYVSKYASQWAYSNHILRVVPQAGMSGWLYAFLRSRTAFRILRSFATGSKQQDLHPEMLASLPVPKGSEAAYSDVNALISAASSLRDEAFALEEQAKARVQALILGEAN